MTTPPPPPPQGPQNQPGPGPWPLQPPVPGQPPFPPPGQMAPGQPYGYGMPPGQVPGWPPVPPKRNGLKWALGAVALIAVIAVAVAVTLAVTRNGSGGGSGGHGTDSASAIASADDNGPVSVITKEPTCDKFVPINDGLANQSHNGWADRDPSIPATEWTPSQRAQYQAVRTAMLNAADQYVELAKETPHRVVRELYEQTIAYARAYADAIPRYTAVDDHLARATSNGGTALLFICKAISLGSANMWGSSVPAVSTPSHSATTGDPTNPQKFMPTRSSICDDLITRDGQFGSDVSTWDNSDMTIPASQWASDQKSVFDAVGPVMSAYADDLANLAQRANDSIVEDFLILSAQYLRAYVPSIPTYVPSNSFLSGTANMLAALVVQACKAVGG